ncbi:MAG TPA: RHS repeat-associated core domain-containing protein, partial [Verrucomicrobiae bacterium]|nr:RHS repeat-associated core domain-containing protein [Verrucomicrobiae bacterium]
QIQYRYDRIGNMLSATADLNQQERGVPVANLGALLYGGSLGASNRTGRKPGEPAGPHALTSIQNQASSNQFRLFSYDDNGNMTSMDGLQYTWDFKDRLVAVEDSSVRASYTYDYSGRRITKTVSYKPAAGKALPRPARLATTYVSSGFEVRDHEQPTKYIFENGTRIASAIGTLSSSNRVERFRLARGWNLISLGVSASNLVGQLTANSLGVQAVYRWNDATSNFNAVLPGEAGAAGSILWIQSATNLTAGILGRYSEPATIHLGIGETYLASPGLEAWAPAFSSSSSAWAFDAQSAIWQEQLPGNLSMASDFPQVLAVGQPAFVRVATPTDVPVPDPALRLRYYHEDHLRSSAVLTDAAGNLIEESAFFPFGARRSEFEPRGLDDPYQFSQKERDTETGLLYFGKRFYAPGIAKWLSTDPLEEKGGGFNPYAYVNDNPVRFQDRDGGEIHITREKGHVITIHMTAVLINDSPMLAQRGYDMNQLATQIKDSIEHSFQGTIQEGKGHVKWTVKTKVDSLKVVDNWSDIQPGKKGPHVFHTVNKTYDAQAANARIGGMLITMGAPDLLMKKPSDLSAAEQANPANKDYQKGYQSPGTIGAHEFGHDSGLSHVSDSDRENLLSEGRWYDNSKITSAQLQQMVETIEAHKVNDPTDVVEEKSKHR